MKEQNYLMPLDGEVKIAEGCAFDTETYGKKNDFLMGSIVDNDVKKVFWDRQEMTDYLIKHYRGKQIFATNLGFDLFTLFKHTKYIHSIKPVERGSKIIFAALNQGRNNYNFFDTLSYYPASVEQLGKIVNIPKLPHPEFLGKKKNLNTRERQELEAYNLNDSLITFKFSEFLRKSFFQMGCNMKKTISSTSMDLFRRKYLTEPIKRPNPKIIERLMQSYSGGRTETIKRGYVDREFNYYDLTSAYISEMRNSFPNPNTAFNVDCSSETLINDYDGISFVVLKVPDLYVPFLFQKGMNKLLFPKGFIAGHYTHLEIRKALKLGYKIDTIGSGIIYRQSYFPFKKYMENVWEKRKQAQKDGNPIERMWKVCGLGLYGKFGQRITNQQKVMPKDLVSAKMLDEADDYDILDDFVVLKYKIAPRLPCFVNPIFSSYTTAYVRSVLYDYMKKINFDFYACDTDSLFSKREIQTDNDLGGMKLECVCKNGFFVKPKFYFYEKDEGGFKAKIKGCRGVNSREQFMQLLKDKKNSFETFCTFRRSLRSKEHHKHGMLDFNEKLVLERELNLEDDKRIWPAAFNPFALQDSVALSIERKSIKII